MAYAVLMIDDDKVALQNYGAEIKLNLGIEPYLTDDPEQVLRIVEDYPIRVLVTDQVMPTMAGMELVGKVRDKSPDTVPIMLSGYTGQVSPIEAVRLDLFRMIDKNRISTELTQAVREALQHYDSAMRSRHITEINADVYTKRRPLLLGSKVVLRLLRVSSIDDPYVKEGDWRTDYVAQRNIKETYEVTSRFKVRSAIEHSVVWRLSCLRRRGSS